MAIHLVVSALLNTAGWGQSSNYAPVDYNFQKEPFPFTGSVLGHTFAASDNAYYEPNLSCLAANGYGQWTAGTGPGVNIGQTTNFNNPQWFLLSNMLCDGDITIPNKVRPKGIVASGSFLNPRPTKEHSITGVVIKVCTNLQGRVRYVWPNWDTSTGKYEGFVIQGFNDSRWGAVELSSSQQIDIGLASMNETPVQNPETRKIVVKPIFNYVRVGAAEQFLKVPNMNLKIGVPTGSPDDPVYEFDWRDVYDIAMDTKFLYIVWEDVTDDGNGIYSWNVKGVAIDLATGEVARWYDGGTHPKPSNPTINEPTSGKIMLNGMIRPTVACDVRNNPTDPTFDVAAIKVNQAVDPSDQHRVVAHIGVEHREVSSGSITPRVVP
ncbi:MAG TPA: hypothetical protein VFO76_08060, partial [Candidatus Kapabacteria bacterium]|nr:hypothetical protein [Candidatus Kapabacteria bacterium]